MSFLRSKEISTKPYRLLAPLSLCLLLLTACDEPIALNLTVDELISDDPIVDVPINDTPIALNITIDELISDDPIIDVPINDTPIIVDDPVIDFPINDTPIVDVPVIDVPINDTPIVDDVVVVDESVVDVVVVDAAIIDRFYFSSSAEMDAYFHKSYGPSKLPVVYNQEYYGVTFAFTGKSWLSFYIDMHKNTGDQKWLDYAETTIDYMFSRTDDKLLVRNQLTRLPYFQGPQAVMDAAPQKGHLGWSIRHSSGRRIELLEDGVTSKYIMKFIDYVLANNIPFDGTKLNTWIDTCTLILKSHDSEFVIDRYAGDSSKAIIDGSYYYTSVSNSATLYSNPLGFNHSANAASAMYLINKYRSEPEFTIKQQAIVDFMLRNFKEVGDHYSWPYGVNSSGAPLTGVLEDLNHSAYDADFIVDMYHDGYIDESVMNRLLMTVPVFLTETRAAHSIDGSGSDDGGDRVSMYEGYLRAAKELNPAVHTLIVTNLINYMDKSSGGYWHAKLAAAATIANEIQLK